MRRADAEDETKIREREVHVNIEWFWCEKDVEILDIDCFKIVP